MNSLNYIPLVEYSNLYIGNYPGSSGSYNLSGSGAAFRTL